MNRVEFNNQYARLMSAYPQQFINDTRMNLIFEYIEPLPQTWFKTLVDRIILSSKPNLDIMELAAAEKRGIKKTSFEKDLDYATKLGMGLITENGLQKHLDAVGAKTLLDAVFKKQDQDQQMNLGNR